VFGTLEQSKRKYMLHEYSVSQVSLEDIFLSFTCPMTPTQGENKQGQAKPPGPSSPSPPPSQPPSWLPPCLPPRLSPSPPPSLPLHLLPASLLEALLPASLPTSLRLCLPIIKSSKYWVSPGVHSLPPAARVARQPTAQ
ncbi:hypothetical protein MC885_020431, partial [Smutsia gigantea]